MKKILDQNPYNVPKNDLYGRLYFYIVDKMKSLVKLIKSGKLKFIMYKMNAIDLMPKLQKEGIKFDRIDVSNISDENYVGLKKCLALSAPLLKKQNLHAKLITTLMNWIAGTEFSVIAGSNSTLISKAYKNKQDKDNTQNVLKKLMEQDEDYKNNPLSIMEKMSQGTYLTNLLIKYTLTHHEVFDNYLLPY